MRYYLATVKNPDGEIVGRFWYNMWADGVHTDPHVSANEHLKYFKRCIARKMKKDNLVKDSFKGYKISIEDVEYKAISKLRSDKAVKIYNIEPARDVEDLKSDQDVTKHSLKDNHRSKTYGNYKNDLIAINTMIERDLRDADTAREIMLARNGMKRKVSEGIW